MVLGGAQAGVHRTSLRADLDRRVSVGHQVVEPGRVARMAALRSDEHHVLAVGEIGEGGGAHLPGPRPNVVEKQHRRRTRHVMADQAAARSVDGRVAPDQVA